MMTNLKMILRHGSALYDWDDSKARPYDYEVAKQWLYSPPTEIEPNTVGSKEIILRGLTKMAWLYRINKPIYPHPFITIRTNDGRDISSSVFENVETDILEWLADYLNKPLKVLSPKDFEANRQNITLASPYGVRKYWFDAHYDLVYIEGEVLPPTTEFHADDQFSVGEGRTLLRDEAEKDFWEHLTPEVHVQNIQEMVKFDDKLLKLLESIPDPNVPEFHVDDSFSGPCGCERCEADHEADGEHPGALPCGCEGDEIDTETGAGILCQKHYDQYVDRMSWYPDPMEEGIAPLSHDNTLMRKMRKHKTPRSRRHMKGSNRYRLPDPAKKVKARLKRDSRHQNRPEVEEAVEFLKKFGGKTIAESDLQTIQDHHLFAQVIDFLAAMSLGGWIKAEEGITNGHFIIESEAITLQDGKLLWNNNPLKLDHNWLYSIKELLQKRTQNG